MQKWITVSCIMIIGLFILSGCEKDSSTSPKFSTTDMSKFEGTWTGDYECLGQTLEDQLTIASPSDSLDFIVIIHETTAMPDTVYGKMATDDKIVIPQQSMGGFPGTAEITYANDELTYKQTAFGLTCTGTGYKKN